MAQEKTPWEKKLEEERKDVLDRVLEKLKPEIEKLREENQKSKESDSPPPPTDLNF